MRGLVIAGAGTDIGKTHIACGLLRAWRAQGKDCAAFKPVLSGYDETSAEPNDATRLLEAMGQTPTPSGIAALAPWRFKAPLAPPAAAALEARALDFDEVVSACEGAFSAPCAPNILIETAGGVMSPLTERHTMLDLIAALGEPVIFVAGSYLGAISHTLTGVLALRARQCAIAAIIISVSENSAGDIAALPETLGRHGVSESIILVRHGSEAQAADDLQGFAASVRAG